MSEPTREQPKVEPTVSTAPSTSRWRWSNIPSHVGPARTSTLVLAVLFVAIFALYLNVRPPVPPAGTVPTGTDTQQPAVPTTQDLAPAPATTAPVPETTEPEEATPTQEPLETTVPTETLPPEETTPTVPTSPSSPTSGTSSPTTSGAP